MHRQKYAQLLGKYQIQNQDDHSLMNLFILEVLRRFQHCTGHIRGSLKGSGNKYIQLVMVLYCKLLINSKQLPAFPLEVGLGTKLRSQGWEARVLPLCHRGPIHFMKQYYSKKGLFPNKWSGKCEWRATYNYDVGRSYMMIVTLCTISSVFFLDFRLRIYISVCMGSGGGWWCWHFYIPRSHLHTGNIDTSTVITLNS